MIRFGSRGSDLALTQTKFVAEELKRLTGTDYEIEVIQTRGDQNRIDPLPLIGGKGLFTAELETALHEERIDIAVHSLKDLPVEDPAGLTNGAIPARERPHDVLVFDPAARDPEGGSVPLLGHAVVGTSSPRRSSSLLALRPDLDIRDIRGNVETRARKVRDGDYDATVLAAAGLARLQLQTDGLERVDLPVELSTPAPGQGALGVQCRADDAATRELLEHIHDPTAAACVAAERQLLFRLGGGCSMPLGALVTPQDDGYRMLVSLFSETRPQFGIKLNLRGDDPNALSEQAAAELHPLLGNPLAGQRIALLRPGGAGGQLNGALGLAGAEVETVAVSEILPIYVEPDALRGSSAVAFTSARAVDRFFEELAVAGIAADDRRYFAVGAATAAAVHERGFACEFPPDGAGGGDLATFVQGRLDAGTAVLFPCAEARHGDFESGLAGHLEVRALPVYRTLPLHGIELPEANHVVFTSPSAVRAFRDAGSAMPADATRIALGATTARAMHDAELPPTAVAAQPTAQALVTLLQELR